jgi:hypothetical protein
VVIIFLLKQHRPCDFARTHYITNSKFRPRNETLQRASKFYKHQYLSLLLFKLLFTEATSHLRKTQILDHKTVQKYWLLASKFRGRNFCMRLIAEGPGFNSATLPYTALLTQGNSKKTFDNIKVNGKIG